ncbi:MAG: hypothetical protein K2X03_09210 [Bryobacteraceae bacterium]|nr:hypothetical protein [Bryobacteraceae bacterium]
MIALLLPAVAMMLGWGLRGFIGGGPLGAMIPGAMVALAICLTRPVRNVARACVFGAIAIGFGGEMTYGQTVGAANAIDTRAWGLLGLSLKGGVWGLLGGAMFRLGFTRIRPWRMAQTGLALIAACWLGWKVINQPKLIYFSNRLDRPREEVWAGLLLAGLVLVAWRAETRHFAWLGAVGGALGFGLGGALQAYGIEFLGRQYPWWKGMEFTFGLLFGCALGWAARELRPTPESQSATAPLWQQLAAAALCMTLLFRGFVRLQTRFDYLILGLLVLWLLTLFPWAQWQAGISVTVAATMFDLARVHGERLHYAAAGVAGLLFAVAVARYATSAERALLLLTWSTTLIATAKFMMQGDGLVNPVGIAFIVMALMVTWLTRQAAQRSPRNAP